MGQPTLNKFLCNSLLTLEILCDLCDDGHVWQKHIAGTVNFAVNQNLLF